MRLIDAEQLKADVFKASMDKYFMPVKLLDCDTVTEMIDGAPTIDKRKMEWIPVTERLPEERLAVLVWCPQRSNIYCAYHDKRNVNKVVYSEWFIFGAFNTLVNEDVVAWMPLPKPYKEADDADELQMHP